MRNTHTHTHSMSLSPAFFTLSCPYFLLLIPLSLHPYPSRIHRPPPLPFLFLTPLAYSPSSSLPNSPFFYHRPSPFTTALTPSLHPHQFRLMSSRFSWMILPHTYHTHKGLHTHTPHTQRITRAHTRKIHGPRTRIHTPHEQTPRRRKSNI